MSSDQQSQMNTSLNRSNYQDNQTGYVAQSQSTGIVGPYPAFPANVSREYDPRILERIIELVERKYCPNDYIKKYEQNSKINPVEYPPLTEEQKREILRQGGFVDVSNEVKEFEIARVYNKLEIEIFEISMSLLPENKQKELIEMSQQSQSLGQTFSSTNSEEIHRFMAQNVPNIDSIVIEYMNGFVLQYLAGRY